MKHYTVDGHTEFEMPLVYLFDVSISNNAEKSNNSAKLLESQSWKLSAKKPN